jgi:RNA polymerase sporulation-specific sigma factor
LKVMDDRSRALAEENVKLVPYFAEKYKWTGFEVHDLTSICNLALCKAAMGFDESRGYKFSTFAGIAIRFEIIKELSRNKNRKLNKVIGRTLSLNDAQTSENEDSELLNILGKSELLYEIVDISDSLPALHQRNLKTRIMFHVQGYSQKEIAQHFKVTQSRIAQILKKPVLEGGAAG